MSKTIYCKHCLKELSRYQKKFCSSSCSASFNNKGRIRTIESRQKMSKLIKQYNKNNPRLKSDKPWKSNKTWIINTICVVCKSIFWTKCSAFRRIPTRKTCSDKCHRSITIKNGIRTNRSKIFCKEMNKIITLDSSWEKKIALFLNENNIIWTRPNPLKWIDLKGKPHNYYPDFYLPDYNIYLDPKNPYCMSQDKEKLDIISEKYTLFYGNIKFICEQVERLIGVEPT